VNFEVNNKKKNDVNEFKVATTL